MDILNSFLSVKIKNRIKLIQIAIENPIEFQNKILKSNIEFSKKTLFGEDHNFKNIKTYRDFQNSIPVRDYEDIKSYIILSQQKQKNILWPGRIKYFAKSSGTTNISKFIPITKESLYSCHFKAGKDMLAIYLNNNSNSKILNGKSMNLKRNHGI